MIEEVLLLFLEVRILADWDTVGGKGLKERGSRIFLIIFLSLSDKVNA